MKRRTYLISAATLVATTGCLGTSSDGTSGDGGTPTDEDDGTPTPTPSQVLFGPTAVQPGYITRSTPDSIGVLEDAGQYLLAKASHQDGQVPKRSAFELQIGDETVTPEELRTLYVDGEYPLVYDQSETSGWLVFGVPEGVSADAATVTWPGGEWRVPSDLVESLTKQPAAFEVTFEAPDTVTADETPTLTMEVTNPSDVDGTFVYAMNRVGPAIAYTPVRGAAIDVGAGKTVTKTWEGKAPDADASVTYHLNTVGDRQLDREITLQE
ncbi:hypothetical protein ACKVMT_14690 [Halobacteriales archaeon Cl-PHB]